MAAAPQLTRVDRYERHQRLIADYGRGLSSRAVAALHGLSDSHVRAVVRLYEVARPVGRPSA